jgi:hypothetical protein
VIECGVRRVTVSLAKRHETCVSAAFSRLVRVQRDHVGRDGQRVTAMVRIGAFDA